MLSTRPNIRGRESSTRTRVENLSRSCRTARWSREQFDAIAEASQFADHLARSHLLRLGADGRSAFLVAHALVKDLPDQRHSRWVMAPIAWAWPRRGTSRRYTTRRSCPWPSPRRWRPD